MATANYNLVSSNSKELLGVVIDSEVTFAKHIWRKTNQKPHALARVANFMSRLVLKAFVFFPNLIIVWMCHKRKLNNKINRLKGSTHCIQW